MEIAQHACRGQEQARRATSLEGEAAAHRSLELHVDYGVQGLVGRGGWPLLHAVLHSTSIRGCFSGVAVHAHRRRGHDGLVM